MAREESSTEWFEYRVRWRSHKNKVDGVSPGYRLRYEKRETELAARSVADSLSYDEEERCRCYSDMAECDWCRGVAVAPTEITIHRRPVGDWEEL